MVVAACIAGVSMMALLPLYVSSCRSILAAAERMPLSERVTALLGTDDAELTAGDFDRVLQLVRLCPEHGDDRGGIRAITVYQRAIELGAAFFGRFSPRVGAWSDVQRRQCAHFAAIVLDRSISSSRRMLTQQAGDLL
jgi:hypothetical protein